MSVSLLTSSRPSTWPIKSGPFDLGGRGEAPAIDGGGRRPAIAGEGAAQVRDQRMPLPVRGRQKLRRHHPERQATRLIEATGIGVVAAGELDRGLDQEGAGIIADRAERIVIDLERPPLRLAR